MSVFDGGMAAVAASCETLFTQTKLLQELRNTDFQLAIVDLLYNECGLALAHHLRKLFIGLGERQGGWRQWPYG